MFFLNKPVKRAADAEVREADLSGAYSKDVAALDVAMQQAHLFVQVPNGREDLNDTVRWRWKKERERDCFSLSIVFPLLLLPLLFSLFKFKIT